MPLNQFQDQIVWIIGASSGIGLALSHELARRGARLILSARRQETLDQLVTCLGPQHRAIALDVTDVKNVANVAQQIKAEHGRIDRILFLAASYAPMSLTALDISEVKSIIDTNLMGAFNLIHAVMPILTAQSSPSQLALCGSVAGFIGLPSGQPYSATKAGIINLAETLRAECPSQIDIKLINPGFVRTPLTDKNTFDMPLILSPEQAAQAIAHGLCRQGFEIHFPFLFTIWLKLLRLLPYCLSLRLTRYLKPSQRIDPR